MPYGIMPSMDSEAKWTLIRPYLTSKQWRRIDLRRKGQLLRAIAAVEGISLQAVHDSIKRGTKNANKMAQDLEKPMTCEL